MRREWGYVDFTPGEFIGWMGRCDTNLTAERACDEITGQLGLGYSEARRYRGGRHHVSAS